MVVTRVDERLWRVDMVIVNDGQEGHRRIEGRSCQSVTEAAALVIALTIDPTATMGAPDVPEPPQSRKDVAPQPAPTIAVAPAALPRGRPQRIHVAGGLTLGLDAANAPSPTPGLEGAVGMAGTRWRVDVGGSWWLPQEQSTSYDDSLGARFSMMAARVRGCADGVSASLRFGGCLAAELGFLRAEGRGLTRTRPTTEHLPAVAPLAYMEWPATTDVRFRVELGGSVNLRRPTFELTDELVSPAQTSRLHTVPAISARLGIGVTWAP